MTPASMGKRQLWRAEDMDSGTPKDFAYGNNAEPCEDAMKANLISSAASDGSDNHFPTLDIDFPCRLVESSPGRHHLFIDVPCTWEQYQRLLDALADCGICEGGWVEASKREGSSLVRLRPEERRAPR